MVSFSQVNLFYSQSSPGITCSRDDKNKEGKANALGVDNIGGVFVVLLAGLAVAIITAIVEFCWNSRKNAHNQRVSRREKFLFLLLLCLFLLFVRKKYIPPKL